MIRIVVEVAGECGLCINKGKSSVLLYNCRAGKLDEVGGTKVVSSIRYLGTDVGDSRLCFGECQKGKIRLAEKKANLTFSIIARSCNKMVIGKTYWKSVVQPRVLSATAVMVWMGGEVEQMQRVENRVWRQILGGTGIHAGSGAAGRDRSINC